MSLLNNLRVLKDVRIGGNLDVAGETTSSVTSISTTNLNIKDKHIFLNKDHTVAPHADPDGLGGGGGYVVNAQALLTVEVWDDNTASNSFESTAREIHIDDGKDNLSVLTTEVSTGTVGTPTVIITTAGASAVDDYYNGWTLTLTAGPAVNEKFLITDYDGATKTFTLSTNLPQTLDATSAATVAQFVANDFIQVSDSRDHTNDGLYTVETWSPTGGNGSAGLLTVKNAAGTTYSDFIQTSVTTDNQLQSDPAAGTADSAAHVSHVRVSLFRHEPDGTIIHSHGDDEDELDANASTLQTTPPNKCIVVGATSSDFNGGSYPTGHPPLTNSGVETILDLTSVLPQHLAELYIMDAEDVDNGGSETTLKLIMPDTSTLTGQLENTQIRVVRKQGAATSNLVLINTTGSDVFDDGETPTTTEIDLLENADKVDLSSCGCGGLATWYMG